MLRFLCLTKTLKAFVLFFASLQFCIAVAAANVLPQAEKGVLDLRDWDFSTDGRLELAGEWAFYWQSFVDPSEIDQVSIVPDFVQVPGVWQGLDHHGQKLQRDGYATYRLKVLMPENAPALGLYLKRVQSAYQMYINGTLWMQAGLPGKTADAETPAVMREYDSLKGLEGDLDIVVHISNHTSYVGGGFFSTFTIGPDADQELRHLAEFAQDLFLTGALLCLGGFLVALHIGRFKERTYLALYSMCFASAIYILFIRSAVMELMPTFPYYWAERLSYISAVVLIALTYEFIHQVNPRKISLVLSRIILGQAALITLFVVFWPYALPVELAYVIGVHLLVTSISCTVEVRSVLSNKVTGAWLVLLGVAVLMFAGVHDLMTANGIIHSIYLGPYAILMLLLFFASILALRVNTSITRNEQLAQAIRSLDDSVAIFDGRDQAVIWNDAYARHLSTAAQKSLKPGVFFVDLVRADAYSGELQNAIGREQEYIRERMQRHYLPGETFEMERTSGWYLYREAETPDGGRVTLASDLSSQKAKELELQLALQELVAANAAKNSFLSNMSHELRTPLNAINGFSDMMVQQVLGPLNEQYQEYAGHISRSGKHLLRLVTDMLDVARIETGKLEVTPEAFDLSALLDDCVKMELEKLEARKLTFEKSIPKDLAPLYADPVRVRQIILNLMDNAIKFTKPGGEVSLKVELDMNRAIAICVQDTGVGIAEDHIETALQKFGQIRQSHLNAHEGLGLGLSIAQILMQLHGGKLKLQSQLGVGTAVIATFLPEQEAKTFFAYQAKAGTSGE